MTSQIRPLAKFRPNSEDSEPIFDAINISLNVDDISGSKISGNGQRFFFTFSHIFI